MGFEVSVYQTWTAGFQCFNLTVQNKLGRKTNKQIQTKFQFYTYDNIQNGRGWGLRVDRRGSAVGDAAGERGQSWMGREREREGTRH